jgi:hypothetical protein
MTPTRAAGRGCLLRALRAYALFVLACVAVGVSLGYLAAGRAVRRAERAWAERGEPMETFAGRFPERPDSPAGLELDRLTRPLGIQMCGPYESDPAGRDKARNEFLQSVSRFLGDCGRSGNDQCAALPRETATFLERESRRLDAIETHILEGGALHWAQDIEKGVASPIPRLLGHRQIQSLILARALAHEAGGRPPAVERSLEASWVLNASYVERPELISRLIAIAVSGMQNAVLRTVRNPSDRWLPRVQQQRFAAGIRAPYQLEAWNWMLYTKGPWGILDVNEMESGEIPRPSLFGTPARFLTAPYVRLSFAGISEALLTATETLLSQKRCDFDVDRYAKDFEDSFPRWNILGRIATPSVVRGYISMRSADLDTELSEQVLAARASRRATGRWPSAPAPSTVCEGIVWEPRTAADGSITIGPNAKPFVTDAPNWRWSIRLRP